MTTSVKEMPGTSASEHSDFKASRKIRNARKIIEYTELRGTTKVRIQAENFVSEEFKVYVEAELFIPQQIFNYQETASFGRKIPKRSFIHYSGRKVTDRA